MNVVVSFFYLLWVVIKFKRPTIYLYIKDINMEKRVVKLTESDLEFLIKKILKEELDGFEWMRDNSISGTELRELILQTRVTNIPFDKVWDNLDLRRVPISDLGNLQSVDGDLDLSETPIESLGNLQSVGGDLSLYGTPIQSLGNLQSVGGYLNLYRTPINDLGNLQSVGGSLNLYRTPIESLGNLQSVGGDLDLAETPVAKKHSGQQIRQMVEVGGDIYM